jgi:hypothetical protein
VDGSVDGGGIGVDVTADANCPVTYRLKLLLRALKKRKVSIKKLAPQNDHPGQITI